MSHDCARFWGRASLAARAIALVAVAGAAIFSAQEQKPPQAATDTQKPPSAEAAASLPKGPMAEKAATACTECHEARILLQQRLSKAAWTREVDKMVKWGAVVNAADRDALIEYLSTNFSPDQPPYEPPRTSFEKTTAGKTSR